ncbi:hypothetical protein R3P38DRAFT_3115393 [Favolaschia claudopus]|uniref:DUF6535 domain-containing protein n=1 Tax=Favolaschia claudopus TaxID=2862362 RepID=A0AAV9ZHA6_9AGAR
MEHRDASLEDDDAAGAKIWSVYVSEAEKYDKALVQSWKSDMEGLLIFAGLFSAILTAFLIESYKTLTPDSDDDMVLLLGQISAQLSGIANGSTVDLPAREPREPFVPPASSLVCNLLWFISLGLSLSCALTATLVEQWARDFIYKTEMRSSPITRARIFSYLYYGLKRFNMHAVVEVIPLLLHLSLLFFFAGLIAFLVPVNRGVMILSVLLLTTLLAGYATFSVFPVLAYDSPYHTPLSGIVWRSVQVFNELRNAARTGGHFSSIPPDRDSMVQNMIKVAVCVSKERSDRDLHALRWTVKSLADDSELEPFLDGIPDALWSSKGRRRAYDEHIMALLEDRELRVIQRLENFLRGCNSDLLPAETQLRRRATACKALWAIATVLVDFPGLHEPSGQFDHALVKQSRLPLKAEQYEVSARAVLHFTISTSLLLECDAIIDILCLYLVQAGILGPHDQPLSERLAHFRDDMNHLEHLAGRLDITPPCPVPEPIEFTASWIMEFLPQMNFHRSALLQAKRVIFTQYMVDAACLDWLPYEFEATRALFLFDSPSAPQAPYTPRDFGVAFNIIVRDHSKDGPFPQHADEILADLLINYKNTLREDSANDIRHLATYLTMQNLSDSNVLEKCDNGWLYSCLIADLMEDISLGFPMAIGDDTRKGVKAIWELAFSAIQHSRCVFPRSPSFPPKSQDTLNWVRETIGTSATPSAIALIQIHSLMALQRDSRGNKILLPANPFLANIHLPADPHRASVGPPSDLCCLDLRVAIVAEFIHSCRSTISRYQEPPYKSEDTMRILTDFVPAYTVTIQQHFAAIWRDAMKKLSGTRLQVALTEILLNSRLLSMYEGELEEGPGYCWLNDPNASRVFIEGLTFVEQREDISSALRTSIQTIRSSMAKHQRTSENNVDSSE